MQYFSVQNRASHYGTLDQSYEIAQTANNEVAIWSSDDHHICSDVECEQSDDLIARDLYKTVKSIYDFFNKTFDLKGIDGKGGLVPFKIHWDEKNAQWGCVGRNCSFTFNDMLSEQEDVVAHEYTHGIISRMSPLNYSGQAGALNESCADIMGLVFKNRNSLHLRQDIVCGDWTIGSGLRDKLVNRNIETHVDMKAFKTIGKQVPTADNDYGHVHDNSKIPSHAFFYAVTEMDRITFEANYSKMAIIWFLAMKEMKYNETFESFAKKTIKVALQIKDGVAADVIHSAWQHVSVLS